MEVRPRLMVLERQSILRKPQMNDAYLRGISVMLLFGLIYSSHVWNHAAWLTVTNFKSPLPCITHRCQALEKGKVGTSPVPHISAVSSLIQGFCCHHSNHSKICVWHESLPLKVSWLSSRLNSTLLALNLAFSISSRISLHAHVFVTE